MKQTILYSIFICVSLSTTYANAQRLDTVQIIRELENQYNVLQQQQKALSEKITRLTQRQIAQETQLSNLQVESVIQQQRTDSLQIGLMRCVQTQSADRSDWTGKLQETNASIQANNTLLSNRTLWGITIGSLLFLLLATSVFLLLRRIKRGTTSIAEIRKAQDALQVAQTKIQEESLSLDNKLLEIAEKQIAVARQEAPTGNHETDHSLALKVADEVTRIEMNLARMDASVKGHKQLAKAVERIKSNFLANGYEMVDMLGKPYHDGMKVIANFVSDENLKEGEQIITGIIKPQINYNGQMIQAAQITVSQNI